MKKLNLEVIFGAKDNLSPALKHMIGGSKATASALDKTIKQVAKLKVDQKNIESYKKMRGELDQTTAKIKQQKQIISDFKKQADLGPLSKKQAKDLSMSQKSLERLNTTYARQSRNLTDTVQKMNQAGVSVKSLAQDESNLKDKILLTSMAYSKQKQAIDRINLAQQQYQKTQDRLSSINRVAGKGMLLAGAGAAATAVPVKIAIDFESSMAEIAKVVDGLKDETGKITPAYGTMSKEILAMSSRLPMAATDIATIIAAGGQSGIATKELTKFAETAVKMGVAFDISADESGQAMAELRSAFRMSQADVTTLADQINYLGNNTPAAAKGIMQIVQRIGPLGEVGGFASGSIAALGATMRGMGVQEEIAATGIKNMMLALIAGESATKSQRTAMTQLGLNSAQVAKSMQQDAEGTTLQILKLIQALPKERQGAMMSTLFGKESISAIAPMLTNMSELEKNLGMVADKMQYAGSMDKEYAARAATTANNLQLLKNGMSAVGITIGNVLLPQLNNLVSHARGLFSHIQAWAEENPVLSATLVKVAVGAIALVGAVSSIALALTTIIAPIAFLKMSLATLGGGFSIFSLMLKALISPIKMMGTAFLFVGKAMLANPMILAITAIVVAIAGAAYLIYKNWEPIKGFFSNLWTSVKNAFATGVNFIKGIIQSVDTVFANNPILNLLFPIIGIPRLIIANWSSITAFFSSVWSSITSGASDLWNSIVSFFNPIGAWFSQKWESVKQFTSFAWSGIKSIVSTAWNNLVAVITNSPLFQRIVNGWTKIFDYLGSLKDRMLGIGRNIIDGLVDGIKSGFEKLKSIWATINSYMPSFMQKKMDIHSPSRVFASLGGHIMGGLQVGLNDGFPQLKAKFSDVMGIFKPNVPQAIQKINVQSALNKITGKSAQPIGQSSQVIVQGDTITMHIHAQPGQSIQDIANVVSKMLDQRQNQKMARARSSYIDTE